MEIIAYKTLQIVCVCVGGVGGVGGGVPVLVPPKGIYFAIMSQNTHWLCAIPAGEGVRGES